MVSSFVSVLVLVIGLLMGSGKAVNAGEAAKTPPSGSVQTSSQADESLGRADAPLLVEEFASLTCSHCAQFFVEILPVLEKRYVETGKVRFVFHDFPLDGLGLHAAALARCMPEGQHRAFLAVLYKNLSVWALDADPKLALTRYAALGGLAPDKAKACWDDAKLLETIAEGREHAIKQYDIRATPTFILNHGQDKMEGAPPLDAFVTAFDRALTVAASLKKPPVEKAPAKK